MTEIEVITAANDSGLVYYGMGKDRAKFIHHLEAFAALVAAAARADEREECVKVCERTKGLDRSGWPQHYAAHELAAAIRARGTT